MSVDITERVDVVVSLGTQPISTASFDSAMFLADTESAGWPVAFTEDYRVFTSLKSVADAGFAETTSTYKFAALVFGGNFAVKSLYVVRYTTDVGAPVTPTAAFNTQLTVDDTPYYVACDVHTEAVITPLVAAAEAAYRMVVVSSQEAGILVPATTTDLGSVLQSAAYDHVFTLYHPSADTTFAEGGVIGAMAAIPAGVSTLEDKTMTGVTSYSIDGTATTSVKDKNVGYYSPIAGVKSLFNSRVASGQFFDTIVFSDWLRARIGEAVYGLMKRRSDAGLKVSYDENGTSLIRSTIFGVIQVGLANGAISPDIYPLVRTPSREEVSEADRTGRVLPDVVVEVLYSNAVHKVLVRAYVSV
ncbi:tail sheath protein [Rheinheimera phage vB_RspM_Barba5A]|uniref:Tail sheath protein n=1 Tax=Rheinheimera phage vB_RspM_Barba5A TaxID=2565691 RepID=A0A4P8NAS0_9CAUD|nr:tail sheath protein [Rheinheimera phage vB_RspM_Barba5A]